jgi:hypothetical protein
MLLLLAKYYVFGFLCYDIAYCVCGHGRFGRTYDVYPDLYPLL